ncbi:MAG: IS982 family transposase [Richelia sp. RM1_1_1]|nr:IS982 family transposase [Richelia sp. RM1_1_1]
MNSSNALTVDTNNFDLVQIFCIFDDVIKLLKLNLKPLGGRPSCLSVTEVCTIVLLQKEFNIGHKKALYKYLRIHHQQDFPTLGSYKSFNSCLNMYSKFLLEIIVFLMQINYNQSGELVFIDSTTLPVCKIWRERKHKTMKHLARKSKTTTGWFYGLKLHILCDEKGNLLKIAFTTGNVDDRVILNKFLEKIKEKIIGADGGYVSNKCQEKARENNNILLNAIRSNMKGIGAMWQQEVLNMRSIVECCFSVMKSRLGLINTLARSVDGYLAHYIRCLFMYCFKDWLRLEV